MISGIPFRDNLALMDLTASTGCQEERVEFAYLALADMELTGKIIKAWVRMKRVPLSWVINAVQGAGTYKEIECENLHKIGMLHERKKSKKIE